MLRKTAVNLGNDVMRSGVSSGSRALTEIVADAPVKKSIKRHFVEEGRQLVNRRLKPNKTAFDKPSVQTSIEHTTEKDPYLA